MNDDYTFVPLFENDEPSNNLDPKTLQEIERIKSTVSEIEKRVNKNTSNKIKDNLKVDYKKELNETQLNAVTILDGPLLVIAGAGSGKTRVIEYRTSYLIESGIKPENILLLTFTNRAASEIQKRVQRKLGNINAVEGRTFHSAASYLIRRYKKDNEFTIIDTEDTTSILEKIRKKVVREKNSLTTANVRKIISACKNLRLSKMEYLEKESMRSVEKYIDVIEEIERQYSEYKKISNLYDFDDLIEEFNNLMRNDNEFKNSIQNQYTYIMVDEYQDTNIPQKEMVELIAEKNKNICVVGDDSQSIYAFRGANVKNILLFPETYKDCKVVRLEENYRSNKNILDVANFVISDSVLGYKKNLFTKNTKGDSVKLTLSTSQDGEAYTVREKIEELIANGVDKKDIAVLYRFNDDCNYLQRELTSVGIPFKVYGGLKFIGRKHVKDILALLRIVKNYKDRNSWQRTLLLIPGIGGVSADKIVEDIVQNEGRINLDNIKKLVGPGKFEKMSDDLSGLRELERGDLIKIFNSVLKWYLSLFKDEYDGLTRGRIKDLEFMLDIVKDYKTLDEFLIDFTLEPPTTDIENADEKETVTLSTIHSAKGLEWEYVFIINITDSVFPRNYNDESLNIENIEEDRRILYVAITRAKKYLHLTIPEESYTFGQRMYNTPSRFLNSIKDGYLAYE